MVDVTGIDACVGCGDCVGFSPQRLATEYPAPPYGMPQDPASRFPDHARAAVTSADRNRSGLLGLHEVNATLTLFTTSSCLLVLQETSAVRVSFSFDVHRVGSSAGVSSSIRSAGAGGRGEALSRTRIRARG